MSKAFGDRYQPILDLSIRANEEAEARIRELIKGMIVQKIERGGSDLAANNIRFFQNLTKLVSALAPKNPIAQALPKVPSAFDQRRKSGMYENYLRTEGKIDRMKGGELFRLFRTFTEKSSVEDVLDSLDGISS